MHPYYTVALAPAVAALVGPRRGVGVAATRELGRSDRAGVHDRDCAAAGRRSCCTATTSDRHGCHGLIVVAGRGRRGRRRARRHSARAERSRRGGRRAAGRGSAVPRRVLHRDRRDPAPRHDPDRRIGTCARGSGSWIGRRGNQRRTRRHARGHPHQWSAATNGSQSAAALEIASGTSVMAIGGWSGDPVPTLEQFVDDVHAGKITYYVEAGRGRLTGRPRRRDPRDEPRRLAHPRDRRLGRRALSRP